MTKIFKRVVDIIFIIAIIVLASYFVLRMIGKIEISEVETGSMEDGIHAGDYVLIFKANTYKIGDVITFKKDGYYVTHRIVKKHKKGIVTKGDANNTEDDAIKISSIVGKVIYVGGALNIIIKFKYAIASLFFGLYLLSYYFNKKKEENNDIAKEPTKTLKKATRPNKTNRKKLKKRIKVKYRKNI